VLRWSPPLVRLPVAEVVASAGETISATCRRAFLLFGFNGLVVGPVGRRGRGPFHNDARAEVIAIAGESSLQRWSSSSVLRWSPPLASRLELAIPRPYWCGGSSYLQSRYGTRALEPAPRLSDLPTFVSGALNCKPGCLIRMSSCQYRWEPYGWVR
jgi:hypothetical protein